MQNGIFILEGDYDYKITVGINSIEKPGSMFSLNPNPATNEVECMIVNQQNEIVKYRIADVLGKTILEDKLMVNEALYKTTINLIELKTGCYFITLEGNKIHETKKIIIQN